METSLVYTLLNDTKRGAWAGREKPHKLILWLSVLNLIEAGHIKENKIYLDAELKREFSEQFDLLAWGDDLKQIAPPFFHLRSSGFWHHKVKTGQEEYYCSLTTSGGGSGRIEKSIEYAFLDDQLEMVFEDQQQREKLRRAIVEVLEAEKRIDTTSSRSGPVFHESFALNRPAISAVIQSIGQGDSEATLAENLRMLTNLGTNYVKAMPRYATCCGLREVGKNQLTPLGQYVLTHDASLSLPATQWLMHYHLSAPHGPGPRFWHDLTLRLPELGASFGNAELMAEVGRSVEAEQGRTLVERSLKTCATVYAGTYTKSDGLGALGILAADGGNGVRSGEPETVPLGVLAYALAHYWEGQYGAMQTRNLSDLSEPGGFGSLFFMGQFALNRSLRSLNSAGILKLWMQSPPHQVTRPDALQTLLEGIYAT